MRLLCLYNNPCALDLFDKLKELGHETTLCEQSISKELCISGGFDLTISYTYRYIIPDDILQALGYNAVNLHNSFLPWNRGADPNLWSIAENSPRGVTLHYMTGGLDKGDIIAQSIVPLEPEDTLRSSYDRLDAAAKKLFVKAIAYYPLWREMVKRPVGKGSYHSLKDGVALRGLIESYDMRAQDFKKAYDAIRT